MTPKPRWRITNHIHPYGIQTKDCATIEDAFQFIAENEGIISMATIEKRRERKKRDAPMTEQPPHPCPHCGSTTTTSHTIVSDKEEWRRCEQCHGVYRIQKETQKKLFEMPDCKAPCEPIFCDDCPFGELGYDPRKDHAGTT